MPTTTGKATDFIQFSRAANATVVDSDGKIKWAPHNLLLASEQFDAASWTKTTTTVAANSVASPAGPTNAETLTAGGANSTVLQSYTSLGVAYTFGVWLKRKTGTGNVQIAADSGTYTTVTITSDWALYTVSQTPAAGTISAGIRIVTSADEVYAWGAHLYRSDLGGMQANTSAYPMYNPTTPKNLLGFSEAFSNAYWAKTAATVTANSVLAPNGLQTADKVVATNSASALRSVYKAVTTTANGVYTFSVYVKAAEYTKVALSDVVAGRFCALFDLTAVTASSGGGAGYVSSSITAVGDGWFRCSVNLTFSSTSYGFSVIGYPSGATLSAYGATYAGDGTSGVHIWGAQLSDSASLDTYVPSYDAAPTAAAYYGPRRDFDPVTLACKGLLVEEQRTNLALNSGLSGGVSGTPGTAPTSWSNVPTGSASVTYSTDAETVTGSTFRVSTDTTQRLLLSQSISVAASTTYFLSAVVDVVATGQLYQFITWATPPAGATITWSLNGSTVAGTTALPLGRNIIAAILTVSTTAGTALARIGAGAQSAGIAWDITFRQVQVEAGAFRTSYIPTGSATATRSADVASVSTQAFPYSSTEGTVVANATVLSTAAGSRTAAALFVGATTFAAVGNNIGGGGATNADFWVYNSAVSEAYLGAASAVSAGSPFKAAGGYKANDFAASFNGATAVTDTSGAVTAAASQLSVGSQNGAVGTFFNGHIRQITYIPRRLTNAELQSRSA